MMARGERKQSRSHRGRRNSVLLVDDNPELLGLYAVLLRRHGFKVTTAANARQGLHALKRPGRVDHIVSDYNMPGTNGLEFLRRAIHLSPASDRVLLTASDPPSNRRREAEALGVRVVLKSAALDCLLGKGPTDRRRRGTFRPRR